ncbi:MAG: ABC transporter permease [Acidimicrobiales bacterium]
MRSPARAGALRRLLRDKAAVVGLGIVVVVTLAVLFAPWVSTHDPIDQDVADRYALASAEHPLGTDELGRDTLSRLLHGGRYSLGMALAASVGITLLGLALGLASASFGRAVDTIINRVADVFLALPTLVLMLVVVGLLGQGLRNLIISVILVGWPTYARVVRGMAFSVREREFVTAAEGAGAGRTRIAIRHLAPNVIGPVIVLSTIDLGRVLLAVSALSFLGFGVTSPTPEWGAMLSDARGFFTSHPELIFPPGIAITVMVLAFNLAGDGLRDVLDPHNIEGGARWDRRRRAAIEPDGVAVTEAVETPMSSTGHRLVRSFTGVRGR